MTGLSVTSYGPFQFTYHLDNIDDPGRCEKGAFFVRSIAIVGCCRCRRDFAQCSQAMPNLCGQLVFIDESNNPQILHETAREYLLRHDHGSCITISHCHAHTRLSSLLMSYITNHTAMEQAGAAIPRSSRWKSGSLQVAEDASLQDFGLAAYASRFFSDHISHILGMS